MLAQQAKPAPLVELAAWRQNQRIAFQDNGIAYTAFAIKGYPTFGVIDFQDFNRGFNAITGANRRHEGQVLF